MIIRENILRLREHISLLCSKINRDPKDITVVAVSKGRRVEEIKEAVDAGITDIGENKVQEAILKYKQLSTSNFQLPTIRWHMVGHLQTNKVKEALRIFTLIQSVDSLRLAFEINQQAAKINKVQDILVQVNTSTETTKLGLRPDETIEIIREMSKLRNIFIRGLMTIAPICDSPLKTRPYFRRLREIKDEINQWSVVLRQAQDTSPRTLKQGRSVLRQAQDTSPRTLKPGRSVLRKLKDTSPRTLKPGRSGSCQLSVLSMGMTDDFNIAIEEGSSMVRVGRLIFENTSIHR